MPVKELIIVFALISVAWAIVRMEMCYRYYYCCDTSAALNEVVKDAWSPVVKGYLPGHEPKPPQDQEDGN